MALWLINQNIKNTITKLQENTYQFAKRVGIFLLTEKSNN